MEQEGLVTSSWEPSERPARRTYELTAEGRSGCTPGPARCGEVHESLGRFLDRYGAAVEAPVRRLS
jgi:hypothetical protein